jgi:outer membrane biosynthesis protein TonB
MQRRAFLMSLALHGVVLTLMLVNFNFNREYSKPPSVILHVDLNKVQISNKTNLPQKSVKKKKAPVQKKKEEPKKETPKKKEVAVQPKPKTKPKPKAEPKKPQPKPQPKPATPVKDAVPVQKKPEPKKETIKEEPKKTQPEPKKEEKGYDLQSLLASVEKVRKEPLKQEVKSVQNDLAADMGNTGLEGRLDQVLSISEKDFISSKLRECWNIDGGAQNLDEIVVEIKAFINKDGSVRDVKILNKQNYPAFSSVSESAKRAVYICAGKGTESPFYILSQKYADHYGDWKEIYLRFSPLEGVF